MGRFWGQTEKHAPHDEAQNAIAGTTASRIPSVRPPTGARRVRRNRRSVHMGSGVTRSAAGGRCHTPRRRGCGGGRLGGILDGLLDAVWTETADAATSEVGEEAPAVMPRPAVG